MSAINDTAPAAHVGWVDPPRQRGTINIIWSCLTVLLLCSYKCIHMNMPGDEEIQAGWKTWKGIPYRPEWYRLRKTLRKLGYMLAVIVAPEIGVGWAAIQHTQASKLLTRARRAAPEFDTWFDGGSAAEPRMDDDVELAPGGPDATSDTARLTGRGTANKLTLTHAFYSLMGGFVQVSPPGTGQRKARMDLVEYVRFLQTCEPGEREALFLRTEADIESLSKTDSFTKIFAICQSAYLAVECIARASARLPISLIELSTAAYVICAAAMYVLWWDKPYDAEHATVIYLKEEAAHSTPGGVGIRGRDPPRSPFPWRNWDRGPLEHVGNLRWDDFDSMLYHSGSGSVRDPIVVYTIATLFGAVHLAAWNWDFVSEPAKYIWRVCSLLSTVSPLVFWVIVQFMDEDSKLFAFMGFAPMGLYLISRLGVMGLVPYSMSAMSPRVYETVVWTEYFPFIG